MHPSHWCLLVSSTQYHSIWFPTFSEKVAPAHVPIHITLHHASGYVHVPNKGLAAAMAAAGLLPS
jgi:hypothetical protein